jgi:hypothetical protein
MDRHGVNKLAITASAAAVVLLVAVVGGIVLPGLAILGPGATASPSPALIARGRFFEHDWGLVEMEATRQGSVVAGHMTVGEDRDPVAAGTPSEAGLPISVDLECARTTEDGAVLIGGRVTHAPQTDRLSTGEGANALVELKLASPHEGVVGIGPKDAPVLDCIGLLDAWLTAPLLLPISTSGVPLPFLDEGSVEFGPGAEPSP